MNKIPLPNIASFNHIWGIFSKGWSNLQNEDNPMFLSSHLKFDFIILLIFSKSYDMNQVMWALCWFAGTKKALISWQSHSLSWMIQLKAADRQLVLKITMGRYHCYVMLSCPFFLENQLTAAPCVEYFTAWIEIGWLWYSKWYYHSQISSGCSFLTCQTGSYKRKLGTLLAEYRFWKTMKSLSLEAHLITLLLAPFESTLVNDSNRPVATWVFEINISTLSKQNLSNRQIFSDFHRLTMARILTNVDAKAQWEKMPHFSSYLRKRADFGTIRHIVKKWS